MKVERDEIKNNIINILKDWSLADESKNIDDETHLKDDLNLDSLDAVELGIALEEYYGFEIPDNQLYTFETVGQIINYIEEKLTNE